VSLSPLLPQALVSLAQPPTLYLPVGAPVYEDSAGEGGHTSRLAQTHKRMGRARLCTRAIKEVGGAVAGVGVKGSS